MHVLITADEFKTFQRVSSTNSKILLTRSFISEFMFGNWKWKVRQLWIVLDAN